MPSPSRTDPLALGLCGNFHREVRAALDATGFPEVELLSFHSFCEHPPTSWEELQQRMEIPDDRPVLILATCLSRSFRETPAHLPMVTVIPRDQCFHLLCGSTLVDGLQRQRAYLTSPGWLSTWETRLSDWGFDQEHARLFFADCAEKVVLLDTGVWESAQQQLESFAEYVGLPHSTVSVGLDYLTQYLRGLLLEQRTAVLEAHVKAGQETTSNYGMALDLLDGLTDKTTEADAILGVEEIFRVLMAPREVSLHLHTVEGRKTPSRATPVEALPPEFIQRLEADRHIISDSQDGFWVRLKSRARAVGYLEVAGLAFPLHLERYLNLALAIAPLCALAINKARISEDLRTEVETLDRRNRELEEARENIEILSGVVPICMHCKEIRDDQGYWNHLETFISKHSGAQFSHGLCPACLVKHYPDLVEEGDEIP